MKLRRTGTSLVVVSLWGCFSVWAQQSGPPTVTAENASAQGAQEATTVVPRLVQISGALTDATRRVFAGSVVLSFSLYQFPEGGAPLWSETQTLQADDQGHYTALLGAGSPQGLPLDLFVSGTARWLGVQPQLAGEGEQPRVLLVGVPYALKASDADTLGGRPVSAFVMAGATGDAASSKSLAASKTLDTGQVQGGSAPLSVGGSGTTNFIPIWVNGTNLGNSTLFQTGGNLTVTGSETVQGSVTVGQLASKGNPVFSANAYGCLGDGVTDNTGCFSNMLTAVGTSGGRIYFPPAANSYNFSGAQAITRSNITIECAPGVILKRTGSTDLFDISGNNDAFVGPNCVVDGGSQNAGPLVKFTGNDGLVDGLTFQNAGVTTPSLATIEVAAGLRNKVRNVTFPSTADRCVGVIAPSSGSPVKDTVISGGLFTFNPGSASLSCIFINEPFPSTGVFGTQVLNNTVYVGGSNAYGYNQQFQINVANSPSQHSQFIGNKCFATAAVAGCYKMFGVYHAVFEDNIAADQNFTDGNALFNFGDTYWTSIAGNVGRSQSATGNCITIVDGAGNSVTGNTCDGVGNNFVGMGGSSQSGVFSDNVFSGNTVQLASGKTGTCFSAKTDSGTFNASDNSFSGNHCLGTGTSGQTGLNLSIVTGTLSNNFIGPNQFRSLPTGISIGLGVSGTQVDRQQFDAVTTMVSDSGTNSRIFTRNANGTVALASGGAMVTLSGQDAFTSPASYLCSANDQTAPSAVSVTYNSGTQFTLAGNANDTVQYMCMGY